MIRASQSPALFNYSSYAKYPQTSPVWLSRWSTRKPLVSIISKSANFRKYAKDSSVSNAGLSKKASKLSSHSWSLFHLTMNSSKFASGLINARGLRGSRTVTAPVTSSNSRIFSLASLNGYLDHCRCWSISRGISRSCCANSMYSSLVKPSCSSCSSSSWISASSGCDGDLTLSERNSFLKFWNIFRLYRDDFARYSRTSKLYEIESVDFRAEMIRTHLKTAQAFLIALAGVLSYMALAVVDTDLAAGSVTDD